MSVTCASFAGGQVTDLMEGALDEATARAAHIHLAGCPGCSGLYRQMGVVVDLLGRLAAWA